MKVEKVKTLSTTYEVRVTVEKGERINRIRLQGPPKNVASALDQIHRIFHEVVNQKHQEFVGKLVCQYYIMVLTQRLLTVPYNYILCAIGLYCLIYRYVPGSILANYRLED